MKKYSLLFAVLMFSPSLFANAFNCKVGAVFLGQSAPNLVYVTMECKATSPITSGTNGCTAATVSDDTFTFDGSTGQGKMYYSLALTALASQKDMQVSTYGTCPSISPSTPLLYSMKVTGS